HHGACRAARARPHAHLALALCRFTHYRHPVRRRILSRRSGHGGVRIPAGQVDRGTHLSRGCVCPDCGVHPHHFGRSVHDSRFEPHFLGVCSFILHFSAARRDCLASGIRAAVGADQVTSTTERSIQLGTVQSCRIHPQEITHDWLVFPLCGLVGNPHRHCRTAIPCLFCPASQTQSDHVGAVVVAGGSALDRRPGCALSASTNAG